MMALFTLAGTASAKTVETTLWEDTYTSGVELNSETVATFAANDVLRVYVTVPEGGANFKIVYKGAPDWSETTIPSIDNQWPWVNDGETYKDFTLTEADITALAGMNIYIYKGDDSEITKVTLITEEADEEPTTVTEVWSGMKELGDWANFEDLRYDGKGELANVLVGDAIRVTYTDATDGCQIYVCDAASYAEFADGYFGVEAGSGSVVFTIADASVLESIAQKGIVVKGKLATLTKIELLTYASSYDAMAVTIGEDGIATWSSSKKLDFSGTGITAYYASDVQTGKVTLTSTTTAWDYQGYVVTGEAGTYTVPVTTEASYPSTNYLVATSDYAADIDASTVGKYNYIFGNGNEGIGFYKLTATHNLAAHKAYLQTTTDLSASGARIKLAFSDDETTGINDIYNLQIDNLQSVYDLQGRTIVNSKLQRGLYIMNGKKILVK